jgi:hypothetical protein
VKYVNLHDVTAANELLMSMGADDALPKIAAVAIERSLELQHRIDRALRYSAEAHAHNSLHVRQIERILDGSITIDDELNEVVPEPQPVPQPAPQRELSHQPRELGALAGRNKEERKAFRAWAEEQGYDLPPNAVPHEYVEAYDMAMAGQTPPQLPINPRKNPHRTPAVGSRGKLKPGHGLGGRTAQQRQELRRWLAEQGFEGVNPSGRIPQKYIDAYDEAQAELRRMRAEQYRQQQLQQEQREQPEQQQEQAAS